MCPSHTDRAAATALALAMAACLALPSWVTAQEQPPTPAQVIARHATAMGAGALAKQTALVRNGSMEVPSLGVSGTYRIERRRPDSFRLTTEMTGLGKRTTAFEGKEAWDEENGHRTPVDGAKLEDRRAVAAFMADARTERVHEYFGPVEPVEWQDCACWRVRARAASGQERTEYFARATGLFHGSVETVQSVMGAMERITVIKQYGEFAGVKLPVEILQRLPQFDTIIKLTETQWGEAAAPRAADK